MKTMIGIFLILASIALAIWAWFVLIPDFHGQDFIYWFVVSVVVFLVASGVLIGALFIERDLNP